MNIREIESYSRRMSGAYPRMGQLRLSFKLTMVFRGLREVVAIVKEEEEEEWQLDPLRLHVFGEKYMTESSSLSFILHPSSSNHHHYKSYHSSQPTSPSSTHTHTHKNKTHSKPRPILLPLLLSHLLRRPLPQQPLQNLPRSILRNCFDKFNPSLWLLVINQTFFHICSDFCLGRILVVVVFRSSHHICSRKFISVAMRVGHADDCCVDDFGVA